MMAPDDPRQERNGDHRESHGVVAKDGLAGKSRKNIRGHPHRRQNENVNFGMAEEPKHVLPEQRFAAAFRKKKTRSRHPIEQQHGQSRSQHRQCQQQQDRRNKQRPNRQWHAEIGHTRGSHIDDGGNIVDRAHQRRNTEN